MFLWRRPYPTQAKPWIRVYFKLVRKRTRPTIITLTQIRVCWNLMSVGLSWAHHICYWANLNWVEDLKLVWRNWIYQYKKVIRNKEAYSWCTYQMEKIQMHITLHSSLLILHIPFFTLCPSTFSLTVEVRVYIKETL